jgi:hypothetical protein
MIFAGLMKLWNFHMGALVIVTATSMLAGISSPRAAGSSYDLVREFSTNNPSGPWTYGFEQNLSGTFTPFPTVIRQPEGNIVWQIWARQGGGYPAVYQNGSPETAITQAGEGSYPTGTVFFHPGVEGHSENFGVIRFTLPGGQAGAYRVVATLDSYLHGPTSGDCDFHLLKNGIELFGQFLPPNAGTSYSNTVPLAGGDTLDFAIGRGQDGRLYGSGLKIQATIDPVPAYTWSVPFSASLLWVLFGFLFLLFLLTVVALVIVLRRRTQPSA